MSGNKEKEGGESNGKKGENDEIMFAVEIFSALPHDASPGPTTTYIQYKHVLSRTRTELES